MILSVPACVNANALHMLLCCCFCFCLKPEQDHADIQIPIFHFYSKRYTQTSLQPIARINEEYPCRCWLWDLGSR